MLGGWRWFPRSCRFAQVGSLLTIWGLILAMGANQIAKARQLRAEDRWEPSIQRFEQQDEQQTPPEGAILFVGSSSIRRWETAKSFPALTTLNRGFGGSQIRDVTRYFTRIVNKYRPHTIVFYSGDNDVAAGRTVDQVVDDYTQFVNLVEQQLPNTHIVYVPIKPSLARWKFWPAMRGANQRIEVLCESATTWHYADTATPMLTSEGSPRPELFVKDGLHLSDEGYALWTGVLEKHLISLADRTGTDSSSESDGSDDGELKETQGQEPDKAWAQSLRFYASFDEGADADFARGDRRAYTATDISRKEVRPGLHVPQAERVAQGRWGSALRFGARTEEVLFYRGGENLPYSADGFDGTISLWMSLTPDEDLEPGFVDPLQITDKAWNNACFFLDFSKDEQPRHFRLGVFSDLTFWNPTDRNWDDIPEAARPMITVKQPPFNRDRWTHVAFTYGGFNSNEDGVATLYLDGKPVGSLTGRQKFSWNPNDVVMMLGIYYTGMLDEMAVFDRTFTAEEIQQLARPTESLKSLLEAEAN